MNGIALWRSLWRPQPRGATDRLIACLLGAVYFLWLLSTVDAIGYARDEGFYFQAAQSYQRWFELLLDSPALAMREVDRYWSINNEHPALVKSSFALSHWFFHDKLALFQLEGTSYRAAAMAFAALGIAVLYLWGARSLGRLAGGMAALWLAAMPRFFFHAHLACFDVPVVSMWLLCAYAYWRSLRRGTLASHLLCGVAFGLALNTKHNSWFLPLACGGHAAALWLVGTVRASARDLVRQRALYSLISMALLGPALFYLSWPWLWHDTGIRLRAYAAFHLEHVYYNMEYLGQNYFRPPMPRSYAFVMTAATVPVITLAAFVLGAWLALGRFGRWWMRRLPGQALRSRLLSKEPELQQQQAGDVRDPATLLFWALALAVQYAAWLRPGTPIFGGTKHWMTAYPFVVLIAASGLRWALRGVMNGASIALRSRQRGGFGARAALIGALWVVLALPPIVQAQASYPWGLSFYNVLVGGAAGGASVGLNRGFWGYTTLALADEINQRVPPGGSVYIHDTAIQAWTMLRKEGRIRTDIHASATIVDADVALYQHENHMRGVEYQIWEAFGSAQPAALAGLDGVPVIWLYQRTRSSRDVRPAQPTDRE